MSSVPLSIENERDEAARARQAAKIPSPSEFDALISLAEIVCEVPFVSLQVTAEEWAKAESKSDSVLQIASPEDAFFISTVSGREPLWISDVLVDKRFEPAYIASFRDDIRFFAGVPLIASSGVVIGSLSVMACAPRPLDARQSQGLQALARQAVALLEARAQRGAMKSAITEKSSRGKAKEFPLAHLFDAVQDAVSILDFDSASIVAANPAFLKWLDYSLDEVIGKKFWELGLAEQQKEIKRSLATLRKKGSAVTSNFRALNKAGELQEAALIQSVVDDAGKRFVQCVLQPVVPRFDHNAVESDFQQTILNALGNLAEQITGAGNFNKSTILSDVENQPVAGAIDDKHQQGDNPLSIASRAVGHWSKEANLVVQGIREVMARRHSLSEIEPPENQLIEQSWFNVFVTYFMDAELMRIVVAHQDTVERQSTEKQIRFQAHLLDTVGEAVIATNLENEITYWNRRAEALYGWPAHEALGQDIARMIIPRRQKHLAREIRERVMAGETWTGDFVFNHRNGTRFSGLATNTPIYDDGKLVGIVGIAKDISERKHAEILLKESEERFRLLVESVEDYAIFLLDAEGFVTSWNNGAQRLKGYRADEIIGQHFSRFYSEEDLAAGKPELELETAAREGRFEEEGWRYRKDGSRFWANILITAVRDEKGSLRGFSKVTRDITERQSAQVQLQESEENFRLLVESVRDHAIIMLDPSGHVTSWNAGAERLHGFSADEIIGQSTSRFYTEEDVAAGKPGQGIAVATETGSSEEEGWRVKKNGTQFWANVIITAIRDEQGALRGFSKVTHDLTERKKARELLVSTNREILTIWESMTDAFLAVDINWAVSYANEQAAMIVQRKREEVLGRNLWEVFPEALDLSFRYEYQRAMDEQSPVVFEEYYPPLRKWFEVHAYPSTFGLSIYFRDISERKASEQQIRLSELRFQGIVANAPGMVYQLILYPDGEMEIPFVNDGCRRLFSISPQEIRENNEFFKQVVHPGDLADWQQSLAISAANLTPWDWEGRIRLPDGKIKWLQGAARPKRLLNGGTLWDGLLMEITDRKEAEEERDRFFTLSLDMLCIADSKGYFKRLNPAFESTLGYPLGEMMSKPFFEYIHPEDVDATVAELSSLASGNRTMEFVNRYRCQNGIYKWLSWKAVNYEDLIYAVAHDVTPLKEAEAQMRKVNDELELRVARRTEQLARSNEELQTEFLERQRAVEAQQESYAVLNAVIEGSTDIIYVRDLQGHYRMVNSAGANYIGIPAEEVVGKTDRDFFPPESLAEIAEMDSKVISEQTTQSFEQTTFRDGLRRTFLVTKGIHRNPQGQIIGTIGIARDISDLKRQADALQLAKEEADIANQAKSEFLSRMSHELRTPLNAILGYGQILEMRPLDPEESLGISQILSAGWHLLDLVNEILDIARVEAGHIELSLESIDLSEVVPECCSLVLPLADQRNIQMLHGAVDQQSCHVLADRQRLKQVLLNLLSNAIKYNYEGGRVDISCEVVASGDIRVSVRDTGSGLSKQDMTKIFTPFERLNASNSKIEGSGLGLALSQRLLAAMDGTLGVESVEGEGSTFWIELPKSDPKVTAKSIRPNALANSAFPAEDNGSELGTHEDETNARLVEKILDVRTEVGHNPGIEKNSGGRRSEMPLRRILVVEDNQVNQQIIIHQLRNLGYDVVVLDNGLDAIEKWKQMSVDLILMDCNMPRMSGYAAAREIRRREVGGSHIPIIALTANAMSGDREKCIAAGMDDYLSKPIKQLVLAEVLQRWLPGEEAPMAIDESPRKRKEEPTAVLNRERWVELQNEIDTFLLVDLCHLFLAETPELLQTLKSSLETGDARAVGQNAHKVKGSCATMGASRMAKVCREIESSVENGHLVECFPLLEKLMLEYEAVQLALEKFLADPTEFTA